MRFQLKMVNRLSSRTRQMVLGEHTERTGQFVRACGAFAFITIPGITCPFVRFDLYLLSGQIALANGCLGQADACLEGAINLIPELAPSDGETSWVAGSLSNLLSTLLVQPVRTPLGLINLRSMLTVSLKSGRSSCYTFQQILSFFQILQVKCGSWENLEKFQELSKALRKIYGTAAQLVINEPTGT